MIVDATGFRSDWFTELMDESARSALDRAVGAEDDGGGAIRQVISKALKQNTDPAERMVTQIATAIGPDLSVEGLRPRLHLPMMAAIRQGPGFPNLSCLGLLSDRILETNCPASERRGDDG